MPLLLCTMGVLSLELSLTRLFSVVLFYHYAFLVLSLAILGLSVGAVASRFVSANLTPKDHSALATLACLAASLSLLPALYLVLDTNLWLVTTWDAAQRLVILFLVFLVPFTFAGFVVSSTIAHGVKNVSGLYFFDLLGGSLGCLLFIPMMSNLGGPNSILAVSVLWAATGLLWSIGTHNRALISFAAVTTAVCAAIVCVNLITPVLTIKWTRGIAVDNELYSAWNSFSRVSVERHKNGQLWIEMDGGAGSWISDVDLKSAEAEKQRRALGRTGPEIAYWLVKPKNTLVIGPGGGVDVLRALLAGSQKVTGVEINSIIASDVMQGRYSKHSHGLYNRDDVRIVVEDGRTFVKRGVERFDVILLSQVDTWASSASGSYALTENYLYTVEAFEDYLSKLRPGGLVSVTRWEFTKPRECLRLTSVALTALKRHGVSNPEKHLLVALEDVGEKSTFCTVVVGASPFSSTQLQDLKQRWQGSTMRYAFAPDREDGHETFRELILSPDLDAFFKTYSFNVTPTYDDNPFFFFSGRWKNTFKDLTSSDLDGDRINTGAQFLLVVALFLSCAALAAFVVIPLVWRHRAAEKMSNLVHFLGFGVGVGLAYIVIELAMIHGFTVFLGQPVYSLSIVVFSFLFWSSIGSAFTHLIRGTSSTKTIQLVLLIIVPVGFGYTYAMPLMTSALQDQPLLIKSVIAAVSIAPLGFLMGMPLPCAIRAADKTGERLVEWLWAANACASVLGSIVAIMLFVTLGIQLGMALGVFCYALAAAFMWHVGRSDRDGPSIEVGS